MTERESFDRIAKVFSAIDLKTVAILLDVDGTIVDFGPAPADVHVPDELRASLQQISEFADGAVALVSGRPIADLDRLFAPLCLSAVGSHGAEMRIEDITHDRGVTPLPEALRSRILDAAADGVLIEDKGYSLALHYRAAPSEREGIHRLLTDTRRAFPGEALEILSGKHVFEAKRPGVSKGGAVKALMQMPPFKGRAPLFIGDDVTDETVFEILPELGGIGFSVGRHFDELAGMFHSPAEVREALRRLAARHSRGQR